MEQGHVDPVYKYVDGKIKLLKRELQQLKVAHDAVAAEQKTALLMTQRDMASFIIVSTFTMASIKIPHKSQTQLASLTSAARAKVDAYANPLSVAAQFYNECFKLLGESGVETLDFG